MNGHRERDRERAYKLLRIYAASMPRIMPSSDERKNELKGNTPIAITYTFRRQRLQHVRI